jgi:hypothetical protein
MFQRICITEQNSNPSGENIDIGFLAEALIFYDKVTVVVHRGTLRQLLNVFTPDLLVNLLKEKVLSISYLENGFGVHTQNANTINEIHKPSTFIIEGTSLEDFAPKVFYEIIGRKGKSRRIANAFIKNCKTIKIPDSVTQSLFQDLADQQYIDSAVSLLLEEIAPDYKNPNGIQFRVHNEGSYLRIDTNINFTAANVSYHKNISSKHSSLSPAHILSMLSNPWCDLHYASTYNSEIVSKASSSILLKNKFTNLFQKRSVSQDEISMFEDFVLDDSRAIREAVNAGHFSINDVINILPQAKKFREKIAKQSPEVGLAKAYLKEVSKDSWIDKLPPKTVRWALFTGGGIALDTAGLGGVGTVIGASLGAFDTFIFDKLLKGWKPSQFIMDLKKYMKK